VPLPGAFARFRGAIEETLRSALAGHHPDTLYRMLRYHLGWEDERGRPLAAGGGKLLRPTLCLLACQAAGGDWQRALPAAAAVELVHNFSLVHDDIQDRDRERRHRPTVWSVWGEAQGINAGDALLALARLSLSRLVEAGVAAATVVEAGRVLDAATLEMVEGQVLDLECEERRKVGLDVYLGMIEKKTGVLFDCSLRLGGLLGSEHRGVIEGLGRCGRLLGVTFQVRDDMLGVWGAESETGKAAAADIRRRKKSLPVVYALERAQGATAEALERAYAKPELDEGDVSIVLEALDALGAQAYCREVARGRKEGALAALDGLQLEPSATEEIRQVADFMLERDF